MLKEGARKLANCSIIKGQWTAAVSDASLLLTPFGRKEYRAPRAVLLDPPYRNSVLRYGLDKEQTESVADASYRWAIEHGDDPMLRIAYCCGVEHYPCPDGWQAAEPQVYIANRKGQAGQVVYFSPHCLTPKFPAGCQQSLFSPQDDDE